MAEIEVTRQGDVYVAVWPAYPTIAGVNDYFDEIENVLSLKRPFAIVLDAIKTRSVRTEVREAAGDRLKAQKVQRFAYLKGEATVLESVLIRGALAAVYFLAPPGYPTKVVGSTTIALDWAKAQVGKTSEARL